MKSFRLTPVFVLLALLCATARAGFFSGPLTEPRISRIVVRETNLQAMVSVPAGWQSVTLESRKPSGLGAWVPRAVRRGNPLATRLAIALPLSLKKHQWRVRGEKRAAHPLSFYAGPHSFSPSRSSLWRANPGMGIAYTLSGDGSLTPGAELPRNSETREVREADIWQRQGNTLFFFNQYRGLQVIDVTEPDTPVLRCEYPLPAVGEHLYVLDGAHVALLARDPAHYGRSRLLVLDVSGPAPRLAASVELDGSVCESRLVGTALYIALQRGLEIVEDGEVEWLFGTTVTALDLSAPASPVQRDPLWFPGGHSAVMATDRFLFVALQDGADWPASVVKVIDIGAADGTLRETASLAVAGQVGDKFKMNLSGEVFAAFSEALEEAPGEDPDVPLQILHTKLETFSLADPTNPVPLGTLALAPGERLFATRFDGDRAYAVTFEQVDPLWIVDLSDPANPVVAGEVEVPGWSTHIQPLGGRLVTMGVEDGQAAVSLFDVRDPASASLLARVRLGGDASWSEANWDEKAFSVFRDEGLIAVPFEGWSNGLYQSQLALIDLEDAALAERGRLTGRRPFRRTLVHRERLFALSGKELLSVDVTDRDNPAVKGSLELSRTVNRVLASGDYVLQLEEARLWGSEGQTVLRVALKTDPERIVARHELEPFPVAGACLRGSHLYLLQWQADTTNLILTTAALDVLPGLKVADRLIIPAGGEGFGEFEAVWPRPDLMVWVSHSLGYGFYPMDGGGVVRALAAADAANAMMVMPWFNPGGLRLLALSAANPERPEYLSAFTLDRGEGAWGFSEPFVAQERVYLSHAQSERVAASSGGTDGSDGWRVGEYLDVIDYADPVHPTARPPVELPGQLAGVSAEGTLLYTVGARRAYNAEAAEGTEGLCASVYDGVAAYLLARLPLPRTWPKPVQIDGQGRIYLGRVFHDPARAPELELWTLSSGGLFERKAARALSAPAAEMSCFGPLLAVQDNTGRIMLFNGEDGLEVSCGEGAAPGGLWTGLSRAWGESGEGIWIPLDDYGLLSISVGAGCRRAAP